jgi:hypothetical protein
MTTSELTLIFQGPMSWVGDDSIITHPLGKESGIYLWTAETRKGFEIYYVGETIVSFSERLAQHHKGQLSGKYAFYDADALREGKKVPVWKGIVGIKGANIQTFYDNRLDWNPKNLAFIRSVRFFVAPLIIHDPPQIHKRLLHRVEGALIDYLRSQGGNFLDTTRHSRLRKTETAIPARVEGPERLLGFPANIIV